MAYKQSPGRSPFLKTGRDIPLNMISPLHDGTTHPHPGHKEEKNDPALESLYKSSIPVGKEAVDKLIEEKGHKISRTDLGGEHFGKHNVKTDSTIAANISRAFPKVTHGDYTYNEAMSNLSNLFTKASYHTGSGQSGTGSKYSTPTLKSQIMDAYKKTSNIGLGTDTGVKSEKFNTVPSYFHKNTKSQPGGYLSIFGTRR